MKRLLLPLLVVIALPIHANAKSVWLILIKEVPDFTLEKIEMKNWAACQSEGESWKAQGARYDFHCLKGK